MAPFSSKKKSGLHTRSGFAAPNSSSAATASAASGSAGVAAFCAMRSGVTDLDSVTLPLVMFQRSRSSAGCSPAALAISATRGCCSRLLLASCMPMPSGQYAWSAMPFSLHKARSSFWGRHGWHSTCTAIGFTVALARISLVCSTDVFDSPMPRVSPAATSGSIARYVSSSGTPVWCVPPFSLRGKTTSSARFWWSPPCFAHDHGAGQWIR
mmetsp:Transcript_39385/g.121798  ORF Transcript_39385/g.121798 Transcript_39385/m.121798 type:complete len:211 (+) Transcript_39385:141-773(+)